MQHHEYTWQAVDGLHLFAQSWEPGGRARGVVCLVHGIGEHSGFYSAMASALTDAGFVVMAVDLRGNGYSEGVRGHAPSYARVLDDIGLIMAHAADRFANLPCFLYGHSLGGLLAISYALYRRPPLAGVIAVGPSLRTATPPPLWKVALAHLMCVLWPSFQVHNGVDRRHCLRDATKERDALAHSLISCRLGIDVLREGRYALRHADAFPLPLLLMAGSEERVVSLDAIAAFASAAPDCTLKLWDGFLHELHTEEGKEAVFDYTVGWMAARLG